MGRKLVMQPPQHAARGAGMVVLHEIGVKPRGLAESARLKTLEEKAPFVSEYARGEQKNFRDIQKNGVQY